MEEGQIILAIFSQDKEEKLRPALILRKFPKYGDLLVCGITSKAHQYNPELDEYINESHPDFKQSGIHTPGICRLDMLTMLSEEQVKGVMGSVSIQTHLKIVKRLADYLLQQQ